MRNLLNIPNFPPDFMIADTDSGSDDSDDDFRHIPARESRFKDEKFSEEAQDEENGVVHADARWISELGMKIIIKADDDGDEFG